ncbi:uncharacterized protein LOC141912148 [Tubulanus polymorphus]|uniref:uncharacterized protein LOC141912148 n=1 Tax=Tubulanus polymorphus TaxID=672921 RepID=UPI003DA6BE9F
MAACKLLILVVAILLCRCGIITEIIDDEIEITPWSSESNLVDYQKYQSLGGGMMPHSGIVGDMRRPNRRDDILSRRFYYGCPSVCRCYYRLDGFSDIATSSGYYTYSYNPCTPFIEGQCQNVAICEKYGGGGVGGGFNIGNQPVSQWTVDSANNVHLQYTGADGSSDVMIVCDKTYPAGGSKFRVLNEFSNPVTFQVTGSELCAAPSGGGSGDSSGLSVGSALVITFFVLVVVYVIGGVSFLHFHKKAEGTEKIPNKDFWTSIPGLIYDGNMLIIGKLCKRGSYAQV